MGLYWMIEKAYEFNFDDISIELKKEFSMKITESMVEDFAKLSGDYNPLHMNQSYAKSSIFGNRIVHGMLLSSLFSRLIGMYIPGKYALYFSQTLNFQHPCFINEEIFVKGEVMEKSSATKIITLDTKIFNSSGKCLVDGIAKVVIRES